MHRGNLFGVVLLTAVSLASCVVEPLLIPDRNAVLAGGTPNLAVAEAAGVRLFASGSSWDGDPPGLDALLTPVQVTIENRSEQAVRLAYSDFSLIGANGFRYAALAPISGQPRVSHLEERFDGRQVTFADYDPSTPPRIALAVAPRFRHHHFKIAPHFLYLYPGFAPWPFAFPYDPLYYQRYHAQWPRALPTADMISEALPEGVIEAGGRVSGFLYFQRVTGREDRVTFEMKLVGASDSQPLGELQVPFVVRR